MSEPEGAPAPDALQFDQAEFVAPEARACGFCKSVIADQYFLANGKQLCTACHDKLRASFAARSGVEPLLRRARLGRRRCAPRRRHLLRHPRRHRLRARAHRHRRRRARRQGRRARHARLRRARLRVHGRHAHLLLDRADLRARDPHRLARADSERPDRLLHRPHAHDWPDAVLAARTSVFTRRSRCSSAASRSTRRGRSRAARRSRSRGRTRLVAESQPALRAHAAPPSSARASSPVRRAARSCTPPS